MKELSSLREVINKFDLAPKKNLGQNFLLDQNITDKIVRFAKITPEQNILEIGPGPGGLTRSILAANPKSLTVVEQDRRCINALEELKLVYSKLNIIHDDAIKVKEAEIVPVKSKIIANLPYNIGTLLLCKWLENVEFWSGFTLMFQKEVAERIMAKPSTKAYGRLSVISQLLCDIEWHFDLPPEAFFPPPKITSSVISLYPKMNLPKKEIINSVELITKILFNQRRKMLRATLKQVHTDIESLVYNTNIELTQRPEELSVEQFVQVAKNYLSVKNGK